jgi:hypothetical protein
MAKKDSVKMLEAKIEVLACAKTIIEQGRASFICFALDAVKWDLGWSYERSCAVDKLSSYISRQLGKCAYFDEWLEENRKSLAQDKESVKKYRLQWIDYMISCLQEDLSNKQHKKG